jgi:hypothetical protein
MQTPNNSNLKRESSVSILTGFGLDAQSSILSRGTTFLRHHVQTGYGAYSISNVAGERIWPFNSITVSYVLTEWYLID